jgi:hypothetical protein
LDATDVAAAELLLGSFDGLAESLRSIGGGHVVQPVGEDLPLLLGERVCRELLDGLLREGAERLVVEVLEGRSDHADVRRQRREDEVGHPRQ